VVVLFPVTRQTSSGLLAYVALGTDRTVSVTATVFDMPSTKLAGLVREYSKKGPLGTPVSGGAGT
jgi:hypothetical protein